MTDTPKSFRELARDMREAEDARRKGAAMKRKAKFKTISAWAELGHHGLPFVFSSGPIYQAYGPLFHIWEHKREGLTEIKICIPIKRREKEGKRG